MKWNMSPLVVALLALSGCTGQAVALGSAAAIYLTKPSDPPPADMASQVPLHEVWCYQTLASPDCYTQAQNVPAERLIHVEPQNRYPLTPRAYKAEVNERQIQQATADPAKLNPVPVQAEAMPAGSALP